MGKRLIKSKSKSFDTISAFLGPDNSSWRDVMPCYLSVQDKELRIIEMNRPFEKDFGKGIGEYCYSVYKRRKSPCPDCPVLKTFKNGKHHSSEETVITKNGEQVHVIIKSAPLHDERGKIVAVVEMSTNITEVKELQHELESSRQHFKQLFEIVPCYISIQDRDLRIVQTNKLFEQDFGARIGEHCFQAYKRAKGICSDCPVQKTFSDGEVHSREETVTTRDGRQVNIIVYSMPVHDDQGRISKVMEVSTNITEAKRLQHQLAMMGLAVAGIAHRAKNILMGLEGGVFVVNEGFATNDMSEVNNGWGMVERNVDKVSKIVQDLLFCSKEREPKLKKDVCPEKIVREVYELYRARASEEGIELCLEVSETPHFGTFDSEAIHSIVSNLISNALDACRFDPARSGKKHAIVLRCKKMEFGPTAIEVEDNGAGIPDKLCDDVFKGFFSTKGTEGTGLGLLVVQKLAKEHGGTVTFTSKEGEGTMFRVVLYSHAAGSGDSVKKEG
ncbi:MAG: PAS domain-containing sensor histidine kinase [Pseudomonadota bacterium]